LFHGTEREVKFLPNYSKLLVIILKKKLEGYRVIGRSVGRIHGG
jgi:hypothetical protein